MINKKGLSQIIATVLLLLMTIAAAAIIAGVVIPFTRERLDKGTECVTFQNHFKFQEVLEFGDEEYRYNCYQEIGEQHLNGASVRASSLNDSIIVGFNLVFIIKGWESARFEVRDNVEEGCKIENIKMFGSNCASLGNLKIPKSGEVRTYAYNSSAKYDKIEIYPVLKNGRICELSDEIDLRVCNSALINLGEQ